MSCAIKDWDGGLKKTAPQGMLNSDRHEYMSTQFKVFASLYQLLMKSGTHLVFLFWLLQNLDGCCNVCAVVLGIRLKFWCQQIGRCLLDKHIQFLFADCTFSQKPVQSLAPVQQFMCSRLDLLW